MTSGKMCRRTFLCYCAKIGTTGLIAGASSTLLQGCVVGGGKDRDAVINKFGNSFTKVYAATSKALEGFTPEQEYYIGRTIGAIVLEKYKPLTHEKGNHYLNQMGQTLARFSDTPELFDGYHVQLLDSQEINAFATPSGLIFVTRGLLQCCPHEDALAAVLAHEIGHIQLKHGIRSIEKDRFTKALSLTAMEGVKTFSSADLAQLTATFEASIKDITSTMISNGYSRSFEFDADTAAVKILQRVGYDPNGLVAMLQIMETRLHPGTQDFSKTHPSPASRIENLRKLLADTREQTIPNSRKSRFTEALQGV